MKIRNKIVVLFTVLVTVIISLLAISVYYFSSLERKTVFYKRLKSRALYSAQIYSLFGDSTNIVLNRVDSVNRNGSLSDKNIVIFPIDENSKFEFGFRDEDSLLITQDILESAIVGGEVDFTIGNRDAIALKHRSNLKTFVVLVAADDKEGKQRLDELVKILFVNWLIGVCMSAIAGFLFSKRILKPISQIIYEVGEISSNYNTPHFRYQKARLLS